MLIIRICKWSMSFDRAHIDFPLDGLTLNSMLLQCNSDSNSDSKSNELNSVWDCELKINCTKSILLENQLIHAVTQEPFRMPDARCTFQRRRCFFLFFRWVKKKELDILPKFQSFRIKFIYKTIRWILSLSTSVQQSEKSATNAWKKNPEQYTKEFARHSNATIGPRYEFWFGVCAVFFLFQLTVPARAIRVTPEVALVIFISFIYRHYFTTKMQQSRFKTEPYLCSTFQCAKCKVVILICAFCSCHFLSSEHTFRHTMFDFAAFY